MTVRRPVAYVVGVAAALRVPLWLRGGKRPSRLAELITAQGTREGAREPMVPLPAPRSQGVTAGGGDPTDALRAAFYSLRVLARTRLPWWRNTCLYRALAECLVLRQYGIPCRVELGVTRAEERGEIGAHAWVVREDAAAQLSDASMTVLR